MSALTSALAAGEVAELMVEAPEGQSLTYDLGALARALKIDAGQITVETDGQGRALITIYPGRPLATIRAVTLKDLTMDADGRIVVGRYHNGRPAYRRLFDPQTGSAQRFLLFGTTGAGKSRALQLQLIAEKRNGIVTWLCDLKEGQSVPEARGQVDFYGTTPEEAILMLRAGVAVAEARMRRYSAMGRNAFTLGDDPLLHINLEEANRLLERGAPYRSEATYLAKELSRTGRSVGVGLGLAAQASHLEDLGGSDTLRAMLKEGEVTLLRWSSSMMSQLVGDGLLPRGEQLIPIGKSLAGRPPLRSQFDPVVEEDAAAPGTQGMGYLLSSSRPTTLMRHFRIGSIAPLPGLDPEILALYGDEPPTRLEAASHEAAGKAYAVRDDPEAMAELCEAVRNPKASARSGGGGEWSDDEDDDTPPPVQHAALLEDRITTVLAAAQEPMNADAILAAINADGGKAIRIGSVRNALGALADDGAVTRTGRGQYALAP
ncbi:transfer protein [Herbidospora sp. NEAU-GS84]|uniref:Transfer protein n=1 Tax=Herbidospora solisilvae TaxID=2696284 RepID=A0A7C9NNU5_9ACTN|nr:transfer protein [Herbidospora solisilvae]NAS27472.1 transfer protein [Herbidospora solisilvae]